MISYDETGGWGDHVIPITSPFNTSGEWLNTDPFTPGTGPVATGPGFRLPFYVISPWTRGGHVFTAHSDHSSQIMFTEKWLASKGKRVVTSQLNSWRRQHMSDLTQMFDFAHPDLSIPNLPVPTPPLMNNKGEYIGTAVCQANFPDPQPPIPYGEQTINSALFVEDGFKPLRGALTEGRYLVFESNGRAFAYDPSIRGLGVARAVPSHNSPSHRLILHATAPPPATTFKLQFAGSPLLGYVADDRKETGSINSAAVFNIVDLGNGKGYSISQVSKNRFLSLEGDLGDISLVNQATTFQVFSVTMHSDAGKTL